jgi:HPt (histidine-containing phosphotransfer) domain-containing protein
VGLTAHSLKSNAAAFGASGLSAACQVLEGLGAAGRLADAEVALRDVQGAYERLSRDLRALRQTLPARAPEYEL